MSMFTARNYSWLASILRDRIHAEGDSVSMLELAEWLAGCLESENPAFNRARFYHNIWCSPIDHVHGPRCPYNKPDPYAGKEPLTAAMLEKFEIKV